MTSVPPRVRRVVTRDGPDGVATFAEVGEVSPLVADAFMYYGVWGWDRQPKLPISASGRYEQRSLYPPPGGLRLRMAYFPPEGWVDERPDAERQADADAVASLRAAEPRFRSTADLQGHGPLGFHQTDTIDIVIVVSGSILLTVADGSAETLSPGDCVVQNGTLHTWKPGREGCLLGLIQVAGERAEE